MIHAAIILAGGTAKRLGGISKPDFQIAGQRLLDIVHHELLAQSVAPTGIIIVGPKNLVTPKGTRLTLEDPPFGGPLAGIGAGLSQLELSDDSLVGLGTCDAPFAPRLYKELAQRLYDHPEYDGAAPVTSGPDSWTQYLHGVYRLRTIRHLHMKRDHSIRSAFRSLNIAEVLDTENYCFDVDTVSDAKLLAERISDGAFKLASD